MFLVPIDNLFYLYALYTYEYNDCENFDHILYILYQNIVKLQLFTTF